ncbi:hypothetical protein BJ742DRAFT_838177 [Cladochytrium replicatum]|nr:hypothetical protein BJ742DRAFT_838177 [Cladochytrium replicatum]
MLNRSLTYGDEVLLVFSENLHRGHLFADGAVKKCAYVHLEEKVHSNLDRGNAAASCPPSQALIGDCMKAVFRVEMRKSFHAEKALRRASGNDVDADLFYGNTTDRKTIDPHLAELVQAAANEQRLNAVESARMKHRPVLYGSVIQLFNLHCERYLATNGKGSENVADRSHSVLEKHLKKECFFRIVPRFKIRAEGEAVRIGDAVMLQSFKTHEYLTIEINPNKNELLELETYGATTSPLPSGWTLQLFSAAKELKNMRERRAVHSGAFIRLYLKEHEGYMAVRSGIPFRNICLESMSRSVPASPSRQTTFNIFEQSQSIEDDIHIFNYYLDPLNPRDAQSANVFWQIERADSVELVGGPIEWGKPVRLRHPISGAYLQLKKIGDGNERIPVIHLRLCFGAYRLNSIEVHEDLIFTLHPVNVDHPNVSAGSYAQLQHVKTKLWIGVKSAVNSVDAQSRAGSSVELTGKPPTNPFRFSGCVERNIEDYFALSIVDKESVSKFNHIQPLAAYLMSFAKDPRITTSYQNKFPISLKEEQTILKISTLIIYFCTFSDILDPMKREGYPILEHQNLLREIGIIDLLLILLKTPFDPQIRLLLQHNWKELNNIASDFQLIVDAPDVNVYAAKLDRVKSNEELPLSRVFRMVYRALKQFLLGSDQENQLYVARSYDSLSTMSAHLDLQIGAAETLMQLIYGNDIILRSISDQQIQKFVKLLYKDQNKDPAYLGFLIALCRCNGQAVYQNQIFIAFNILYFDGIRLADENHAVSGLLNQIRIKGGSLEIRIRKSSYVENGTHFEWVQLADLFPKTYSKTASNTLISSSSFLNQPQAVCPTSYESLTSASHLNLLDTNMIANTAARQNIHSLSDQEGLNSDYLKDSIFFEAILDLYEALCDSNNQVCAELITKKFKLITAEDCIIGLMDDGLSDIIRSAFCRILRVVFIDTVPYPMTIQSQCYSIANLMTNSSCASEAVNLSLVNERITGILVEFLVNYLEMHEVQVASDTAANLFMLSLLKLIRSMYMFGCLTNIGKLKQLITSILNVLDGKSDIRGRYDQNSPVTSDVLIWQSSGRFLDTEQLSLLNDGKIECCQIIKMFLQMRIDFSNLDLQQSIWKSTRHLWMQPAGQTELNLDCFNSNCISSVREYIAASLMFHLGSENINISSFQNSAVQNREFAFNYSKSLEIDARFVSKLKSILVDLLKYDRLNLKHFAIQLLHDCFSLTQSSLVCASASIIFDEEYWNDKYKRVFDLARRLGTISIATELYLFSSLRPFDHQNSIVFQLSDEFEKIIDDCADICVTNASLSGDAAIRQLLEYPFCLTRTVQDTDQTAQKILLEIHVAKYVLRFLEQVNTCVQYQSHKKVIGQNVRQNAPMNSYASFVESKYVAIFGFLYAFCHENESNQQYLLENIDTVIVALDPFKMGLSSAALERSLKYFILIIAGSPAILTRIALDHIDTFLGYSVSLIPPYFVVLYILLRNQSSDIQKVLHNKIISFLLENKSIFLPQDAVNALNTKDSSKSPKLSRSRTPSMQKNVENPPFQHVTVNEVGTLNLKVLTDRSKPLESLVFPVGFDIFSIMKDDAPNQNSFPKPIENAPIAELLYVISECIVTIDENTKVLVNSWISLDLIISTFVESNSVQLKTNALQLIKAILENKRLTLSRLQSQELDTLIHKIIADIQQCGQISQISKLKLRGRGGNTDPIIIAAKKWNNGDQMYMLSGIFPLLTSLFQLLQRSSDKLHSLSDMSVQYLSFYSLFSQLKGLVNMFCQNLSSPQSDLFAKTIFGENGSLLSSYWSSALVDAVQSALECILPALTVSNSENNNQDTVSNYENSQEFSEKFTLNDLWENLPKLRVVVSPNETSSKTISIWDQYNTALSNFINSFINCDKFVLQLKEIELLGLVEIFQIDTSKPFRERDIKNIPSQQLISYLNHVVNMRPVRLDGKTAHQLVIQSIEILRRIVHDVIEQLEECSRSKEPELWSRLEVKKSSIQNELSRLGCTLMAERLLTSNRPEIMTSALKLLIALLNGGNKQVQDTLEEFWLGTREERFFFCLHAQLHKSIEVISHTKRRLLLSNHNVLDQKVNDIMNSEYSRTNDVMRLIQLIVEGHNIGLQDYVRNQPDNLKSFNLVKDCVEYLQTVVPILNSENITLIIQVFDTLVDLSQGCSANQLDIFGFKIIYPVNSILRNACTSVPYESSMRVKGHAVLCLLSLIEDDSEETLIMLKEINATLDFDALAKILSEIDNYRQCKKENLVDYDQESETNCLECGYLISMLILTLLPIMDEVQQNKWCRYSPFEYFQKRIGQIEILKTVPKSNDRTLHRVLFPIPEVCKYMPADTIEKFLWSKLRNTPQEKIQDFVIHSAVMNHELHNQARVAKNKWLTILARNRAVWWKSAYAVAIIINLINLMCNTLETMKSCHYRIFIFQKNMCLLHFCFWIFSTLEFINVQLPLSMHQFKIEHQSKRHDRLKHRNTVQSSTSVLSDSVLGVADSQIESNSELCFTITSAYQSFLRHRLTLRAFELFNYASHDLRLAYFISMAALSISGLIYPAIYSIHLLDFVFRDAVLHGVIQSVTLNKTSLFKTAILGLIIIYLYAVVSFNFFHTKFDNQKGLYCNSLSECFITILSHGIRAGGGIGDLLEVHDSNKESYAARVALDLSFFLIVIIFLLNVIFGIIFDTFGQLREEHQSILNDLKSTCFVCSINASEFDRNAVSFAHHLKKEHNLMHYLFFIVHLQIKDPTEYTSHESYVSEMLEMQDYSFFPINRAMSLKTVNADIDQEAQLTKILDERIQHAMAKARQLFTQDLYTLMQTNSSLLQPYNNQATTI